jgi:hypothetical protein
MSPDVTAEQRRQMIAEAAYFRAQRRGFVEGDPIADWLAAEADIDAMLAARDRLPMPRDFAVLLARAKEAQLELIAEGLRLRLDAMQAPPASVMQPREFTWDALRAMLESVSSHGKTR